MLSLKAKSRKLLGRKVKQLRKKNIIPAVIYGHNIESRPIEIESKTFKKILSEAGESSLVNLEIDDQKPVSVLIHDLSYHPLTSEIIHIDFYQVKTHEKLTAEIELKFIGESPAVKNLGGILVTPLKAVKVECLPQDLIHEIEVDLSQLINYGDEIKIKDLKIPEKIKISEEAKVTVANIEEPRKEKEEIKPEVAEVTAEAAVPTGGKETTAEEGKKGPVEKKVRPKSDSDSRSEKEKPKEKKK